MATVIERIVEPVIENPVIDILAESTETGETAVAGLVPALKLGPVSLRERADQSGIGLLPEEEISGDSDPGRGATDPGSDTLKETGDFNSQAVSDILDETGPDTGPFGSPSPRSSSPSSPGNSTLNGGEGEPPAETGGKTPDGDSSSPELPNTASAL